MREGRRDDRWRERRWVEGGRDGGESVGEGKRDQ